MVLVTRPPLLNLLNFVSGGTLLALGGWMIFKRVRKIGGSYLETREKKELLYKITEPYSIWNSVSVPNISNFLVIVPDLIGRCM